MRLSLTGKRLVAALGLTAGLVLIGASSASAGVEAREQRQRHRIRAGVTDGSLTRPEAHRLVHQQVRIERKERRFRANDGVLGPRERVNLHRHQNRASRNIFRKRHNNRTRD